MPDHHRPDWMTQGACRVEGADPELFFGPGASAAAKAFCRRCRVTDACLAAAMDADEKYGVWGGTTPEGRRELIRRPARLAAVEARFAGDTTVRMPRQEIAYGVELGVGRGMSAREISHVLDVSETTVRRYQNAAREAAHA